MSISSSNHSESQISYPKIHRLLKVPIDISLFLLPSLLRQNQTRVKQLSEQVISLYNDPRRVAIKLGYSQVSKYIN